LTVVSESISNLVPDELARAASTRLQRTASSPVVRLVPGPAGTIVAGYANRDIASKFAISEDTVKHHLTNIFNKTGASNRLELALFALHHRLVDHG
jgi:FixJ family two-component response regulator